MAKTTRDKIRVTVDGGRQYEAVANAAITPGQLVELISTGKVQKQATAAVPTEKAFAIEDALQGNVIGDDYAAGDRVFYVVPSNGDKIYGILADGENAVIGSKLESNAAGELRVMDTESNGDLSNPEAFLAVAVEAVDASDSATTAVASRRIVIRIA